MCFKNNDESPINEFFNFYILMLMCVNYLDMFLLPSFSANRGVEVNEMWRVRQKEMELNDRLKSRSNDHSGNSRTDVDISIPYRSRNRRHESNVSSSCSSSKAVAEGSYSREHEGLRDNEIDEFL
ncbi:hypothetical protein PVK06_004355 [Gossypium arboreum]|uniref:Uncharacterized protein n=1 Tax=Gossypium arboreum TaxID=29729 RepID=A0ABR0QSR2_GOSAR|nr:hypothetical protein PVK06_004355 [Gossypium arboreum]